MIDYTQYALDQSYSITRKLAEYELLPMSKELKTQLLRNEKPDNDRLMATPIMKAKTQHKLDRDRSRTIESGDERGK